MSISFQISNLKSQIPLALLIGTYAVLWVGGLVSHIFFGGPRTDEAWTAPVFLLLAGVIVVVTTRGADRVALFLVAALGYGAEFVGVRYGFLFGSYVYTDALSPRLFGVPLVMASAWAVLFAYVKQLMLSLRLPGWAEVVVGSLLMTAIDLVIDPLASGRLNYWRWLEAGQYYGVPARNFLGWFGVSLFVFALSRVLFKHAFQPAFWPRYVGLSILLFFTLIGLAHGLALAATVGVGLWIAHIICHTARAFKVKGDYRARLREGGRG